MIEILLPTSAKHDTEHLGCRAASLAASLLVLPLLVVQLLALTAPSSGPAPPTVHQPNEEAPKRISSSPLMARGRGARDGAGVRGDAGAREDVAYEQRKLVAALKVAQEDLATEKAKSSSQDQLSGYFQLARDEKGGLQLSSRVPSLCRDDRSASVMHVTVSSRLCATCALTPLFTSLQAVCPRVDENVSLSIPDEVLYAAALAGSIDFCASVRVERFNMALDDVMRSEIGGAPNLGCRRLTMASGLNQSALPPGCVPLTVRRQVPLRWQNPVNASTYLATACNQLRGMVGRGETVSERAAAMMLAHCPAVVPKKHEKSRGRRVPGR